MDAKTSCLFFAGVGGLYAAQTLPMPSIYLEQAGMPVNSVTDFLCKTTGSGILSVAFLNYIASQSDNSELHSAAITSSLAGYVGYTFANLTRSEDNFQSKLDTGVTIALTGAAAYALMNLK